MAESNIISPGSIGAKIKMIREYRGLSRKELGMACGFSEQTANVRIRQYETNEKTPKAKMLVTLAEALEIDPTSLFDADLSNKYRACHALFDLEDFFGLKPIEIDGKYYMEFAKLPSCDSEQIDSPPAFQIPSNYFDFNEFLKKWCEKRNSYLNHQDNSIDPSISYTFWRYEFPNSEVEFDLRNARNDMLRQKEDLEKRLAALEKRLGAYYNHLHNIE